MRKTSKRFQLTNPIQETSKRFCRMGEGEVPPYGGRRGSAPISHSGGDIELMGLVWSSVSPRLDGLGLRYHLRRRYLSEITCLRFKTKKPYNVGDIEPPQYSHIDIKTFLSRSHYLQLNQVLWYP